MPDIPVEGSGLRAYDPGMEARVARLEEDMREVKGVLGRLEPVIMRMDAFITATLPHLATKADLAELGSEMKQDQAAMRAEFKEEHAALRAEFKEEHAALRAEFKEEHAALRAEFKEEHAALRADVKDGQAAVRLELADKPGKTYLWGILAVLIAAYGAGLAALAILK